MTELQVRKAVRSNQKLRLVITGQAGSGKTYTALHIAAGLVRNARILVVDTENGNSEMYAEQQSFDVAVLQTFHPKEFIAALEYGEEQKYDVVIIDSLSAEWEGPGGILALLNNRAMRSNGSDAGNFAAWKELTPLHDSLLRRILASRVHVICTLRTKIEHVMERDESNKVHVRNIGLQPIFREGYQYYFTLGLRMNSDHHAVVDTPNRLGTAFDGLVVHKPGPELGAQIMAALQAPPAPPDQTAARPPISSPDDAADVAAPAHPAPVVPPVQPPTTTTTRPTSDIVNMIIEHAKRLGINDRTELRPLAILMGWGTLIPAVRSAKLLDFLGKVAGVPSALRIYRLAVRAKTDTDLLAYAALITAQEGTPPAWEEIVANLETPEEQQALWQVIAETVHHEANAVAATID